VRKGHRFTIGLCLACHKGEGEGVSKYYVSYHGRKKMFHAIHGYDAELLARQDDLVKEHKDWYRANTTGGAR